MYRWSEDRRKESDGKTLRGGTEKQDGTHKDTISKSNRKQENVKNWVHNRQ